jgi:hypothetical protein
MFGWFRKKPTLPPTPAMPTRRGDVRVAFSNGRRTWTEETNIIRLLAEVLERHGHGATVRDEDDERGGGVEHVESGFVCVPTLENFQPLDRGGVQTVTTVRVTHPRLVPGGLFEFQHSVGDNIEDAFRKGFDPWAQMDFVTLLDASRRKPKSAMAMEMKFPAEGERPPRVRRLVLGPVMHFRSNPPPPQTPKEAGEPGEGSEHDFCPCCLLMQSFEPFKSLVEGDGFHGIRLYATRDENGETAADCRIDGEDFEAGKAALRAYVARWPQAGVEFRKQYVVVQSLDEPTPGDSEASEWRS